MEYFFADLDTNFVKSISVTSWKGNNEQQMSLNNEGVFRFSDRRSGVVQVLRLPRIKLQVFCDLIFDMFDKAVDSRDLEGNWSIVARDRYGRKFRAVGCSVSYYTHKNMDPSFYLRKAAGMDEMWLLDGGINT
ncbi:MAG: hypothetical protein IJV18_13395 [Acidaminococcaceae bacterium]|nr:hypothetical protein [Acidaminococcaceae bacterium]